MSTHDNKALVLRFLDWWTKGDLSAVDETVADDIVSHTPSGDITGHDALKARLAGHRDFFTQRKLVAQEMIAEGDRVALRYTWSGHANGRDVQITNIAIYRVDGGRLAEEWEQHDTAGLARQTGPP